MEEAEKKVVVFIVEGKSDKAALGTIMKEYFADANIEFVVVRGDITTRDYVSAARIISKIREQLELLMKKYYYEKSHFAQIFHIADTDGVWVPDTYVKETGTEDILYFEDHMEVPNARSAIERNHRKAEILFKLSRTGKVDDIPYRIYYNSCNLEHVLYGRLENFTDEEKEEFSDDFAEKYEGKVGEFINFISDPDVAVAGDYQQSWRYIEKGLHSLERHTNMHRIFSEDGTIEK